MSQQKERQSVEGCFPTYGSILRGKGDFQRSPGFHAAFIDPAFQTEQNEVFTNRQNVMASQDTENRSSPTIQSRWCQLVEDGQTTVRFGLDWTICVTVCVCLVECHTSLSRSVCLSIEEDYTNPVLPSSCFITQLLFPLHLLFLFGYGGW